MKQEIFITEYEKIVLYLDPSEVTIYTKDDFEKETIVSLNKKQLIHLRSVIDQMIDLL